MTQRNPMRGAALSLLAAAALLAASCDSSILSGPAEAAAVPKAASPTLSAAPSAASTKSTLAISFATAAAALSRVDYGTVPGSYASFVAESGSAGTSHALTLTGLAEGATYYYRIVSVGTDSVSATSGEYSAATSSGSPSAAAIGRGIWLLGGISATSYADAVAAVDLYDPTADKWYPAVASVPTPVSFAAYAACAGKLYVIGGIDGSGTVRDLVQIYDPEAGTWSAGSAMTAARANISAGVCAGKIYVLGGSYGPTAGTGWNAAATTFEYDAAGDAWTAGGRAAFGAAGSERYAYTYGNTVNNFGGRTGAAVFAATHDGFVPDLNALSTGTTEAVLPVAKAGFSGAAYTPSGSTGYVMAIGGLSALAYSTTAMCFVNGGTVSSATFTNTAYCLAAPFTAPAAWITAATPYPQSIAFGAAAVVTGTSPARVYQFGGTAAFGAAAAGQAVGYWSAVPGSAVAWPAAWTALSLPRGRWGHGAVTFNE